jgi:hypothetical protein
MLHGQDEAPKIHLTASPTQGVTMHTISSPLQFEMPRRVDTNNAFNVFFVEAQALISALMQPGKFVEEVEQMRKQQTNKQLRNS